MMMQHELPPPRETPPAWMRPQPRAETVQDKRRKTNAIEKRRAQRKAAKKAKRTNR